jgi:hypothetical protein
MSASLQYRTYQCAASERRLVPEPDLRAAANSVLFDHLVGAGEQHRRNFKAERLGGFEIDDEVDVCDAGDVPSGPIKQCLVHPSALRGQRRQGRARANVVLDPTK